MRENTYQKNYEYGHFSRSEMLLNIIPNYIEPILKYYFRDCIFTFLFPEKEEIGRDKKIEDFNFFRRKNENLLVLGYFECSSLT